MNNLNKWLSVILSFSLCLPLYAFTSGDGTYENPYEIAGQSDIVNLIDMVQTNNCSGLYFLQTADIDLSSFGNFQGIGSPSAPFSGSYDGDGYFISNLYATATIASTATTNAFGFIAYAQNATIENVSVQGKIDVSADYNASACIGVGGVVGVAVKGLYAGLHNFVDIDVKVLNAPSSVSSDINVKYGVGGVIGLNAWTTNSGTLHIGCENYGNIYVDGVNGACCVGGCFTANVPDSGTDTTFSGWNNYGKVLVNGTAENSEINIACVGGVGAYHSKPTQATRFLTFLGCSNFGSLVCSNSVNISGIAVRGTYGGEGRTLVNACSNYADIVKFCNVSPSGRHHASGLVVDLTSYIDFVVYDSVNFGDVKVSGDCSGAVQIGGIGSGSKSGSGSSYQSRGNKNFGLLEGKCPNATAVVVGGIFATEKKGRLRRCENYGNINVSTSGSVLVGGLASITGQGLNHAYFSDCVNFGSITAIGNSNTNYSPCVGGVVASTRLTGNNTRNITISNCYNLGRLNLNLNDDTCYGAIYGVANTYGNYSVSIKNCYALMGEGQSLIGAVNAENGSVILENCVGIVNGLNGGIAASVVGSNNWSQANTTIATYNDCYHNPSLCLGNMFSGTFFPAEKSTNYFDLILPINTTLFATPSASDKKNHNWTKANGYKRYITTIQNNQ